MPVSDKWGPWHLNESLAVLSGELEKKFAGITIWSIGDSNHTPPSDHLPNAADRVNAIDIPIDKHFSESDCQWLISILLKDPRIKYVIHNRRIWKPSTGWKPYNGSNPHTGHVHVSVVDSSHNVTRPWISKGERTVSFTNVLGYLPTLQLGDQGTTGGMHYVIRLQLMLDYLVADKVEADGVYGPKTAKAVSAIMGGKWDGSVCNIAVWNKVYGIVNTPPNGGVKLPQR